MSEGNLPLIGLVDNSITNVGVLAVADALKTQPLAVKGDRVFKVGEQKHNIFISNTSKPREKTVVEALMQHIFDIKEKIKGLSTEFKKGAQNYEELYRTATTPASTSWLSPTAWSNTLKSYYYGTSADAKISQEIGIIQREIDMLENTPELKETRQRLSSLQNEVAMQAESKEEEDRSVRLT
jgi:FtsZ-binding cell division protein ZapB